MIPSIFSDTICWEVLGRCVTLSNVIFSLDFAVTFVMGGYTLLRTTALYVAIIDRELRNIILSFLLTFLSFYISLTSFIVYGSVGAIQSSRSIGIISGVIAITASFITIDKLVRISHRFNPQAPRTFLEQYFQAMVLIIGVQASIALVFMLLGISEFEFIIATIGVSAYLFVIYSLIQVLRKPMPRNLRVASKWLAYAAVSTSASAWIILLGDRFGIASLAISTAVSLIFLFTMYAAFKSSIFIVRTRKQSERHLEIPVEVIEF